MDKWTTKPKAVISGFVVPHFGFTSVVGRAADPGYYCPAGSSNASGIMCEVGYYCLGDNTNRAECQGLFTPLVDTRVLSCVCTPHAFAHLHTYTRVRA